MKLLSEAHSAANQNTLGTLRGADMMMSMVMVVVVMVVVVMVVVVMVVVVMVVLVAGVGCCCQIGWNSC